MLCELFQSVSMDYKDIQIVANLYWNYSAGVKIGKLAVRSLRVFCFLIFIQRSIKHHHIRRWHSRANSHITKHVKNYGNLIHSLNNSTVTLTVNSLSQKNILWSSIQCWILIKYLPINILIIFLMYARISRPDINLKSIYDVIDYLGGLFTKECPELF